MIIQHLKTKSFFTAGRLATQPQIYVSRQKLPPWHINSYLVWCRTGQWDHWAEECARAGHHIRWVDFSSYVKGFNWRFPLVSWKTSMFILTLTDCRDRFRANILLQRSISKHCLCWCGCLLFSVQYCTKTSFPHWINIGFHDESAINPRWRRAFAYYRTCNIKRNMRY